jgi:FMN phosphatase YigB (HAD superfamily)
VSTAEDGVVFLLDVDNTLLDNDRLKADLASRIAFIVGPERAARFWEIYEQVRVEEGYVDYPETVKRWAAELQNQSGGDELMALLDDLPFAGYVYPHALDTLAYLQSIGPVAIVSDGDQVFQPLKIRLSGLFNAVHGNVLITIHKEQELKDVFARFPANHYVVIDDKPGILSALERDCPTTFTTIQVMQGHYATQAVAGPRPDYVVNGIADVRSLPSSALEGPNA